MKGIEFVDGVPQVTWSPNLNTNGIVRSYTIWGKENLTDAARWGHRAWMLAHPSGSAHPLAGPSGVLRTGPLRKHRFLRCIYRNAADRFFKVSVE